MKEINEEEFTKKWTNLILDRICICMRHFVDAGAHPENDQLYEMTRLGFVRCMEYIEDVEQVLVDVLDIEDSCDLVKKVYGKDSVEYDLALYTVCLMWRFDCDGDFDPEHAAICEDKRVLEFLKATDPRSEEYIER